MSERRRRSAKRHQSYMEDRLYYENLIRELFLGMNGKVERRSPHYMVVEHSPWLSTWYEESAFIKIPAEEFDLDTLSLPMGIPILPSVRE